MRRFTDTLKWDDPWFRQLPGCHKLVFLYIVDRCNNAGFWEVDEDAICWHTKIEPKHLEGAWKGLERGIKGASGWVWVRRFLKHQKNELLNSHNPAHRQIISLISEQRERFKGCAEFQQFVGAYKGLFSPIGIGTGKGSSSLTRARHGRPEGEFANRLAAIFHRNGTTQWSEKEIAAFGKLHFDELEVEMLERYYARERKRKDSICRRDLQTFLNNYASEVDRARAFCDRQEASRDRKEQPRPTQPRQVNEPSEEELEAAAEIAKRETEKLRQSLRH